MRLLIDVCRRETACFRHSQPGSVQRHQQRPVLEGPGAVQQPADFLLTENGGQKFRPLRIRNLPGHERQTECFHVQETERGHCLNVGRPGNLTVLDEVKLKLLDLFSAQQLRAAPEVPGKLGDVAKITNGGNVRVVTALQFLLHPPAQ
jgi:hypothetical protein